MATPLALFPLNLALRSWQYGKELIHFVFQAERAAGRWEQQQREIRMTADLQRMRAEMDRTVASQELRLANEMTDNQRRLMETIMHTNRQLLEQQRNREETLT